MSPEPTGRSLSDQLKHLQYAEPPLNPSDFTLDDVVRGGRRRRQRRTVAQIAAAVVAVAALGTGVALPRLNGNGATPAGPTISSAPALPRIDLSDGKLKLAQKGAAVTVSKNGTVVATLTLTSATYTAKSGHAVFSMDAKQPVLIDTTAFTLYDDDGGENSADSPRKLTLPAGKTSLTVDFSDTHAKPAVISWIPQDGASDGGLWER